MEPRTRRLIAAAGLAGVLLLGACGGDSSGDRADRLEDLLRNDPQSDASQVERFGELLDELAPTAGR